MKKTLLLCTLAVGTLTASAQLRTGEVATGTRVLGSLAGSPDREVTDTLPPGSWYYDSGTQLTMWGALCGSEPNTFPCGYIVGTNGYGDLSKAQQFYLLEEPQAAIEGVLFWFYNKAGNGMAEARLYEIDGLGYNTDNPMPTGAAGIAPGTVRASKAFSVADVDTGDGQFVGFTEVLFDAPVTMNEQFALGFYMGNLGANDSLALLATSTDVTDFSDFSWEQWDDGRWFSMRYAWGAPLNVDFCIFALIGDASVGIDQPGSMNNMRMSFRDGNIVSGAAVTIDYDVVSAGRMTLMVHDAQGRVKVEQDLGQQGEGRYNASFETASWANGTYFVTLKNNGRPITKKMVVQK
jgi:hypothetical protein